MKISLIVAVAKNNVIGKGGIIPWKIPGEQLRFKELTLGKTIIMGRKSYEEIGKPLPNRRTILVSRTKNIISENCITVNSIEEAFELTKNEEEVFIAGGGQIYKDTFPYADKIYLTVIDKVVDGDVYFPEIREDEFVKTYEKKIKGTTPYTYYTFEKKK